MNAILVCCRLDDDKIFSGDLRSIFMNAYAYEILTPNEYRHPELDLSGILQKTECR